MPSWSAVQADALELAALVEGRFRAHGLGYLATLRADGSPRISGVEPLFADGEVRLGMMPGSRKGRDLRRDARCALHAANVDPAVEAGDARIGARAVTLDDPESMAAYATAVESVTGRPVPPGAFELFRLDVTEIVFVRPEGDALIVRSWTPRAGERRVERR